MVCTDPCIFGRVCGLLSSGFFFYLCDGSDVSLLHFSMCEICLEVVTKFLVGGKMFGLPLHAERTLLDSLCVMLLVAQCYCFASCQSEQVFLSLGRS